METKNGVIIRSPYAVLEHYEKSYPISDLAYVDPNNVDYLRAGEFVVIDSATGAIKRPGVSGLTSIKQFIVDGSGTITQEDGLATLPMGYILMDDVSQHRTDMAYRKMLPVYMGPWPIIIATDIYEHTSGSTPQAGDLVSVGALTDAGVPGTATKCGFIKLDQTMNGFVYGNVVSSPNSDGIIEVMFTYPTFMTNVVPAV